MLAIPLRFLYHSYIQMDSVYSKQEGDVNTINQIHIKYSLVYKVVIYKYIVGAQPEPFCTIVLCMNIFQKMPFKRDY